MPLETTGFDEPRRIVARRIAEHGTCVRQIERLRRDPLFEQLSDRRARLTAVAGSEVESRADKPLFNVFAQHDVAIADLVIRGGAFVQFAGTVERGDALDDAPRFAAVTTRVHCKRAANRARNAGHEFGAATCVVRGKARQLRTRHAGLCIDRPSLGADFFQHAMRKDHGAAQTAVAHQQIAAKTDHHQRFVRRCRSDEGA